MRKLATLTLGALAVLATACSSEDGQAEPQLSTSAAMPSSAPASNDATSDLPHSGAPAVDNPLPESVVSGDPCQSLDREQVTTALGEGASNGQRDDLEELGPRCRWTNQDTIASFVVTFQTAHREGLSTTYANVKPQAAAFNEVPPIEGYPAVTYQANEAGGPMCSVMVGIANEYAISVTGTLSTESEQAGKDSCEPVQQVASWVVSNLKAQS